MTTKLEKFYENLKGIRVYRDYNEDTLISIEKNAIEETISYIKGALKSALEEDDGEDE